MKKFLIYLFISCILASNMYFIYENNNLKEQIIYLKQENEKLKETPEIYWQTAIEKFNNKSYTETKEILNKLIEKFPTSNLIKKSQEKIKEINLIEKKKKEEEHKIIKSLSKQIANAKNAIEAENKLNFLDTMYDDTYSELKKVIQNERSKLKEKIEKEKKQIEYLIKAEKIYYALQENSFYIMNGNKTIESVVIETIGKPIQEFNISLPDHSKTQWGPSIYKVLLYEKVVLEGNLAPKQFKLVPFRIEIPIYTIYDDKGFNAEIFFSRQLDFFKIYNFEKKYNSNKRRFESETYGSPWAYW